MPADVVGVIFVFKVAAGGGFGDTVAGKIRGLLFVNNSVVVTVVLFV
jgi:hypothetical protein